MIKKKRATHQPFEGNNPRGAFTKITIDMMHSPAWKALNLRQHGSYFVLKSKYRQKMMGGVMTSSNKDDISFPKVEWSLYYTDYRTYKKDMDQLMDLGFIRLIQSGRTTRTPNIYGFCDKWKVFSPKSLKNTSTLLDHESS